MAFSHTHQRQFSSGSGTVTSSKTYSGDGEENIDGALDGTTNQAFTFAVDVSALVSLFMLSSVAATVKVNSTGSPTATISLAAGEAYLWPNGSATNPLGSTDTTILYVTPSGAATGTFQVRALQDATP